MFGKPRFDLAARGELAANGGEPPAFIPMITDSATAPAARRLGRQRDRDRGCGYDCALRVLSSRNLDRQIDVERGRYAPSSHAGNRRPPSCAA
jgi:hypothetical protein